VYSLVQRGSYSSTTTATAMAWDATSRLVYGKDDVLFGTIEELQGDRPWGRMLDAGTGLHSLRWMATLPLKAEALTEFTAITADTTMQRNVQREVDALGLSELGHVLVGNWFPQNATEDLMHMLPHQHFDVILADYLIGAMDGFSPYHQDEMIAQLIPLLKPHGRLYIVGLEPLPDAVPGPANIMCRVRQVRDACILLAGHRCYREYPLEWLQRHIATQHRPTLRIVETRTFPILYRHATIVKQIDVARSKLPFMPTQAVRNAMREVCSQLEQESLRATSQAPNGQLQLGFDYIVAVERTDHEADEL
jgi:hypothetical protein